MTYDKYNGWSSRETWAVALHINNDQGWQESVHKALEQAQGEAESGAISSWTAGVIIRENVEEMLDSQGSWTHRRAVFNISRDIGSLWRVNWDELGASFLSDLENS